MLVKTLSASASRVPKKVVSPERFLVLPPDFDSDNSESLSVQLEIVRLNGVLPWTSLNHLEIRQKIVHRRWPFKKGNAFLKVPLQDNIRPGKLGHHSQLTLPPKAGAERSKNVADPSKTMSQPAPRSCAENGQECEE
jgi:hypothetical protein